MRVTEYACSKLLLRPPPEAIRSIPMPEDPRVRALCRPSDYLDLAPHQQREIDRELGLLDWDGA